MKDIIETAPSLDALLLDNTEKLPLMASNPSSDLLLSPAEDTFTPTSWDLPSYPALKTSNHAEDFSFSQPLNSANASLQNSMSLQDELSLQLAQMATQLKRNAQHFSDALAKDQPVVDDAQIKIEGNHDIMQRENLRTKALHKNSWWTTGYTVGAIIVALVAFAITVMFIRVTKR